MFIDLVLRTVASVVVAVVVAASFVDLESFVSPSPSFVVLIVVVGAALLVALVVTTPIVVVASWFLGGVVGPESLVVVASPPPFAGTIASWTNVSLEKKYLVLSYEPCPLFYSLPRGLQQKT